MDLVNFLLNGRIVRCAGCGWPNRSGQFQMAGSGRIASERKNMDGKSLALQSGPKPLMRRTPRSKLAIGVVSGVGVSKNGVAGIDGDGQFEGKVAALPAHGSPIDAGGQQAGVRGRGIQSQATFSCSLSLDYILEPRNFPGFHFELRLRAIENSQRRAFRMLTLMDKYSRGVSGD